MALGALLTFAAGLAAAATPTAAERHLMASGSRIVQRFKSVGGLDAVVADNGKEKRLFYVTPDGQALIAGLVFDAQGRNVTTSDLSRAGVANTVNTVSPAVAGKVWQQAQNLLSIRDGQSGPVLYAFVDPTCTYCHQLMRKVRPHIQAGRLQVRWLPLALLSRSSYGLAEAMYRGGPPASSLARLVENRLDPMPETPQIRARLARNLEVMRATGHTAVPGLVYRVGNRIVVSTGVPTDSEIAAMLRG